ncbi:MAG TPA: hypothetical protein VEO02_01305 [Thermoanaerobaculia bacterium]|nr:hypothetical protein [Thermoanaerobaculia bacterium]
MRSARRWKELFCVAGIAAIFLAGCRKSERESARRTTAASEAARHPPFGYIDTPKENETVASGSAGYGWALDDSSVASVTASLDNGPAKPAELGQSYPGVKEAYPTFPNSDKAGFSFLIPPVASGPHLLVVTIMGKDGGKTELKRHVLVK